MTEEQTQLQRVVCAAILFEVQTSNFTDIVEDTNVIYCCSSKQSTYITILGARHYDSWMISQIMDLKLRQNITELQQGFIDQFGNFLSRKEALQIAIRQHQIIRPAACTDTELFSEALY